MARGDFRNKCFGNVVLEVLKKKIKIWIPLDISRLFINRKLQ